MQLHKSTQQGYSKRSETLKVFTAKKHLIVDDLIKHLFSLKCLVSTFYVAELLKDT